MATASYPVPTSKYKSPIKRNDKLHAPSDKTFVVELVYQVNNGVYLKLSRDEYTFHGVPLSRVQKRRREDGWTHEPTENNGL